MTNSQLFKAAHAMTKQVIKSGDNYKVTFGLCLKQVKANSLAPAAPSMLQVILFALLVIVQNILDSEAALRIRYAATFEYYADRNPDNCKWTQKKLKEMEELEKQQAKYSL